MSGYEKLTLKDYPGKLAAICFSQGCQLLCPYCHNPDLVLKERFAKEREIEAISNEFFAYIRKRKKILDGIVFSGGEPLLQADIGEVIYKLKTEGFSIKLDTNGLLPRKLEDLAKEGLLDYVALDYKNNSLGWGRATGTGSPLLVKDYYNRWQESLKILDKYSVDYELRTTIVKEIHSKEDLRLMARELNNLIQKSRPRWFLQTYERSHQVLCDYQDASMILSAYSREEMTEIYEELYQITSVVELRK